LCTFTVAHYDVQLKQLCGFLSFLISEVDGSVLVRYCAPVLGDWCPTFRDSMMVPKRLDLITHQYDCITQENGDLNVRYSI
jgi:hypothetical protein